MSDYRRLKESGLPFDWSVILVGCEGFDGTKLSGQEVIDAASDLIGKGPAAKDDLAALLLFVDPTDLQTVNRYLYELADVPVDKERALRLWRLVMFKDWLAERLPLLKPLRYDEVWEAFYDLWYLHTEDEFARPPKELLSCLSTVEELITWHNNLAQSEETWLRENFQ